MTDKDGGSAFACADSTIDGQTHLQEGMSLRQWYAGMALQGTLASNPPKVTPEGVAYISYAIADAMIKEGAK